MQKYVAIDESQLNLLEDEEDEVLMDFAEVGTGSEAAAPSHATQNNRSHCHALLLSQKEEGKASEWALWVLVAISALHIAVQLVGGLLANSLSIVADSAHILTDLASFLISIFTIRISVVNSNKRFTFGYLRAEFIGAMASIVIIWTITILMIVFATQRIASGQLTVDTRIMLITAVIGIGFNFAMALFLKFSKSAVLFSHGHSHFGCSSAGSHGNGTENGQRQNVNVRAAFIHVLGDLLQNVGVLCAALLIRWTHFELADALCTYFFSLLVLCTSVPIAHDIFLVFMETTPPTLNFDAIRRALSAVPSVNGIHSLHIWSLNTDQRAAVAHLIIDDASNAVAVTKTATEVLQTEHKIHFTTVQIEIFDQNHSQCKFCKALQ